MGWLLFILLYNTVLQCISNVEKKKALRLSLESGLSDTKITEIRGFSMSGFEGLVRIEIVTREETCCVPLGGLEFVGCRGSLVDASKYVPLRIS